MSNVCLQPKIMTSIADITVNCKMIITVILTCTSLFSFKQIMDTIFLMDTGKSVLFVQTVKNFTDCWQAWYKFPRPSGPVYNQPQFNVLCPSFASWDYYPASKPQAQSVFQAVGHC